MAGDWGSSSGSVRIGAFYTSIEYRNGGAEARITGAKIRIDSPNITDSSNSWSWSGGAVVDGSQSNINVSGSGKRDVRSVTGQWQTLSFTSTTVVNFNASVSGIEYGGGGTRSVSIPVTFPKRQVSAPATPGATTCVRASATTATVAWTVTNPSAAPVEKVLLDRQQDSETATVTTTTLTGAPTSTTAPTPATNARYRWRVRAQNSSGTSSGGAWSPWLYTTPAAPVIAGVAKSGSDITVTITPKSAHAASARYEHGVVSGSTTTWDGTYSTTAPGVTQCTYTGVNAAQIHVYRVQHSLSSGGSSGATTLYSAWSATSAQVKAQAPPNAPKVSWSQQVVDTDRDAVTLSWTPQPVDATAQTAAEYRVREVGSPTWTTSTVSGAGTSRIYTAASAFTLGATYEAQVRTKATDPSFGAWSASVLLQTSPTPSVSITDPSGAAGPAVRMALYGDSLIEGMLYTTAMSQTVGMQTLPALTQPRRYWIPATVDTQCIYAVSNRDYDTSTKTYSGVARALRIEADGTIRVYVTGSAAKARVWVRRDDGVGFTGATVTAATANATTGSLSGSQTDMTGFLTEKIEVSNPGGWIDVTFQGAAGEILGTEVWQDDGPTPSGLWAFGVSGQNSEEWAETSHRWGSYRTLLQQLGVDKVGIAIMTNDKIQAVSIPDYTAHISEGIGHLRDILPGAEMVGILMPDVGFHDLAPYRAALTSLVDSVIDCTGMPLNGTTVGGDGTHFTDTGNATFAGILQAAIAGDTSVAKLTTSAGMLRWVFGSNLSQGRWETRMLIDGQPVASGSGTGGTAEWAFSGIPDGAEVTFEVRAADLLWSDWVSITLRAEFSRPPDAIVDAQFDESTGGVQLSIAIPPVDEDEVPAVAVQVWRDGRLIVGPIPIEDPDELLQILDPIPPLGVDVVYQVETISAIPTSAIVTLPMAVPAGCWVYLSGGDQWSTVARLKANPAIQISPTRNRTFVDFYGGGKKVFDGETRTRTLSLSGDVARWAADEPRIGGRTPWSLIWDIASPLCYRDPLGERMFVGIDGAVPQQIAPGVHTGISVTLVEVPGGE